MFAHVLAQIDWIQLLQTFGLAVTILAFIGVIIWKGGQRVWADIVIPLRDKALIRLGEFLGTIETTVSKVDANVGEVTSNLRQQTDSLQGLQATSVKVQEATERVGKALETEHDGLKSMIDTAVANATARHDVLMAEMKEVHALVERCLTKLESPKSEG